MKTFKKEDVKRYLISSGVTFVAVFLLTLLPSLSELTLESFQNGVFVGLVATAIRAGVKAATEVLIPYFQSLISK